MFIETKREIQNFLQFSVKQNQKMCMFGRTESNNEFRPKRSKHKMSRGEKKYRVEHKKHPTNSHSRQIIPNQRQKIKMNTALYANSMVVC